MVRCVRGLVELKTERPVGPVLVFGLAGQAARAGVGCAWPWIFAGFQVGPSWTGFWVRPVWIRARIG